MNAASGQILGRNPEFAGIQITMWACMVFFALMTVFRMVTGEMTSGLFYLGSFLLMGAFYLHLARAGVYTQAVWFAESLFLLVWMAGIRVGAGGNQLGIDAGVVAVIAFATVVGTGLRKILIVLLAFSIPILLRVLETRYSSELYVPRPLAVGKIGAGLVVLSMAVVISLLLDRVVAAYFRERDLVKARLETLSRMIVTDGMTGLVNQSHLFVRLGEEVDRARRNGHPLSLVMMDIDDFKAINDSQGHLAGDAVIVRVAGVLQGLVGPPEVAGRRGGDEFLLILPESGLQAAVALAERARESVGADPHVLPVSVSIGVAEWSGEPAGDFLAVAERRLQSAKVNGKNQVVSAD